MSSVRSCTQRPDAVVTTNPKEEVTYHNYLKLDGLLQCQTPISAQHGKPAHDEHLFIITHQAYELWFKQVLVELDSVRDIFSQPEQVESQMLQVLTRLGRVALIIKLLPEQFHILETMSPLDFLEFRGYLSPASGFQSLQFRLLEIKLGVREKLCPPTAEYKASACCKVSGAEDMLKEAQKQPTLLQCVEKWLEKTADLCGETFWQDYEDGVERWLADTKEQAEKDGLTREEAEKQYKAQKKGFKSFFNKEKYDKEVQEDFRRLSHRALQGAMLISLYREKPRFNQPYKLLTLLMDIDALVFKWRHVHVMMVQRMIGSKVGTGGSSGYNYLLSTNSKEYRVFADLFNLSTYYIPRDYVPCFDDSERSRPSVPCDRDAPTVPKLPCA